MELSRDMHEYAQFDIEFTNRMLSQPVKKIGYYNPFWEQAVNEWISEQPCQIEDRWEKEARELREREQALKAKNVQIAEINRQIDDLKKQLEKLEHGRMGKEGANGTVLKIEKRFEPGGKGYCYAAIRADGEWYLTGIGYAGTKKYTWEELKAFVGRHSRVWAMTAREELVD